MASMKMAVGKPMKSMIVIAVACMIGGCLSMPSAHPVIDEKKLPVIEETKVQSAFGHVPIVELGMTQSDVDRLITGYGGSLSGGAAWLDYLYSCGLHVRFSPDKVVHSYFLKQTVFLPQPKDAITDAQLGTMLHSGMTPKEVEEKIGRPTCGYCNKPGTVVLLYEQPGIEVVFVSERLLSWRRVVEYKDEPAPKDRSVTP
jgi:hypothetical protein